MSMLDDYGNQLDASASPGLDTLPAEGVPSPNLGTQSPAPVTDLSVNAQSISPNLGPKPSGAGLSEFKSARSDDLEYLRNLPTTQKVGLVLQSFGAGVTGQPNPIDAMLANKSKREAEFRAELKTNLETVKAGMALVKSMPPGKAQDALIEQVVRASGAHGTMIAEALKSVGTQQEQSIKEMVAVIENPAAQALLIKAAANTPDPIKTVQKLMSDSDFMKRLEQRADQTTLPSVTAKMAVISRALAQKQGGDTASFTLADLRTQNASLPAQYQLTDAELGTINRNQAALIPYGLKTDKTLQAEQEATDKRGAQSDTGKLRADLAAGKITQADFDRAIAAKDNKVIIQNQQIAAGQKKAVAPDAALTPDAIQDAAARYRIDGTLPQNLGRGSQGPVTTALILNKAAALAREEGDTSEEARIRQIAGKANTTALAQLTKQEQMVGAFERNANRNADIALANSDRVDRTGVPVFNRWLLAGKKEVAGDKDVSTFHQANETFANEYAKIMSGSMGNTAVTDSLRKEAQGMLSTKDTPEQYRAVVAQMKLEMGNRMKGFAEQKAELTASMRGKSAEAPATTPSAPAAAVPLPMPASEAQLVKGKRYKTSRGVATWNGTAFER